MYNDKDTQRLTEAYVKVLEGFGDSELKPDESNVYMQGDQYENDSGFYQVVISDPASQHGDSWSAGRLYKEGLDKFKSDLLWKFKNNLPFEKNGTVDIKVSGRSSRGEEDGFDFTWKTHPLYLKQYNVGAIFEDVRRAVNKVNAMNQDYLAYSKWQDELVSQKDRRKGY